MNKTSYLWVAACLLAAFAASSCATGIRSLTIQDMTAEQLKARIAEDRGLVVVDARTEYEYRQGHLPGAINIPSHKLDVISTLLPADKGVEIVFYCRGSGWPADRYAAVAAQKAGYTNVWTFSAGYPAWVRKGYSVEK